MDRLLPKQHLVPKNSFPAWEERTITGATVLRPGQPRVQFLDGFSKIGPLQRQRFALRQILVQPFSTKHLMTMYGKQCNNSRYDILDQDVRVIGFF
jgi:hypothetical protein